MARSTTFASAGGLDARIQELAPALWSLVTCTRTVVKMKNSIHQGRDRRHEFGDSTQPGSPHIACTSRPWLKPFSNLQARRGNS